MNLRKRTWWFGRYRWAMWPSVGLVAEDHVYPVDRWYDTVQCSYDDYQNPLKPEIEAWLDEHLPGLYEVPAEPAHAIRVEETWMRPIYFKTLAAATLFMMKWRADA